jgi:hypothetical protein
MSLKTTESMTNNNMVIVPHPPYSWTWTPVISLCLPNWNWKWKEDVLKQCDIQRESQAVLDSIKENDFHGTTEEYVYFSVKVDGVNKLFYSID